MSISRRDLLKGGAFLAAAALMKPASALANLAKPEIIINGRSRGKSASPTIDFEEILKQYDEEKTKIYSRWVAHLSDKMSWCLSHDKVEAWDRYVEGTIVLENQKLMHEIMANPSRFPVIDCVQHFWPTMVAPELVSIQSMMAPCQYALWRNPETHELDGKERTARTRPSRVVYHYEAMQDLIAIHNIDPHQEILSLIGSETGLEIDREIITDLRNHSKRYIYNSGPSSFVPTIHYIFNEIKKTLKTNVQMYKWMVVSPEIWELLQEQPSVVVKDGWDTIQAFGIRKVGYIRDFDIGIYLDPLIPPKQTVVGCKKDLYAGYVWMPYVLMNLLSPIHLNPDSFVPVQTITRRHAKYCPNLNFYANIVWEGLNV